MIKDVFVVDAAAHSYNLGEDNYAGLDAEALAKNIEGDEFAVERSKEKAKPFTTTYAKGFAQ